MFNINIPIAFGAGVISFFAPCVIPLLPAYIGYVTGVSISELKKDGYAPYMKKLLLSSIFYILGFTLIFVILGSVAAGISTSLSKYDYLIQRIGGVIIIILGLDFAGVINITLLKREKKASLPDWAKKLGHMRAFIVGVIFATAWTPCVGPVLGSILTLAALSGTAVKGAYLLFFYSLGITLPFLIVSLSLASAPKYISIIERHIEKLTKAAGILLAVLGFLLLTNTYQYLSAFIFEFATKLGYRIR